MSKITIEDIKELKEQFGECGLSEENLNNTVNFINRCFDEKKPKSILYFIYNMFKEVYNIKLENVILKKKLDDIVRTSASRVLVVDKNKENDTEISKN